MTLPIIETLYETLEIVLIVFVLMIVVEYLQLKYSTYIKKKFTKNLRNQIVGSSLLGAIPGCVDAFFVVSLYRKRIVGFGALAAVLLSTAGDGAFVMLAMIPKTAVVIFGLAALIGIVGGFIAEKTFKKLKIKGEKLQYHCEPHGRKESELKHFWDKHVIAHIVKRHLPRLFLWIFFALLAVKLLIENFDISSLVTYNILILIVIAALIGLVPESGINLIFITLFAQGLIPFSVLLVNTLSQDGHGVLPLLSHSVKDTVKVKTFTTIFALATGILLLLLGL